MMKNSINHSYCLPLRCPLPGRFSLHWINANVYKLERKGYSLGPSPTAANFEQSHFVIVT